MTQDNTQRIPVLYGHTLADYTNMFCLSEQDLTKTILDCCPGPSSFNAQMHQRGHHVISVDELYDLDKSQLENHVIDVFQAMLNKIKQQQDRYVWQNVHSLDHLAQLRRDGINLFLKDFIPGKENGRYINAPLTALPFKNSEFKLALCSHYLLAHRIESNLDLHINILRELSRVATEVRIFPLLDTLGNISPLVGPIMLALQADNLGVEIKEVQYQFQKKGNAMMRLWAQSCEIAPS